jgi:hypothetical protein
VLHELIASIFWQPLSQKKKEEEKKLSACRGEGSVVGPLLAAHALLLRCAASAMLSPALLNI